MKKFLLIILLFFCQFVFSQNEFLLAENYYRQNEFEKATQLYKILYQKSPYNTSYLTRLLSCYQETKNFSEAEKLITSQLAKNNKLAHLYVYLGYNYECQQQEQTAKTYYKKAISLIKENPGMGYIVGTTFKNYNLLDNAIQAYKITMEVNPKANTLFLIAQVYGEKGDFVSMFESFIDMVDKDDRYLEMVQRYTSKYITDDSQDSLNLLFKKTLLKKSASNPKAVWNLLLSWLFIQQKDFDKAFIQEKALYARNQQDLSGITNLGEMAFDNNDYETAKKCFDFVLKQTTTLDQKINAHYYIIRIAINNEEPDIAQKFEALFEKYGKNGTTIPLQVMYADYLTFNKNNPEKAKEVLEQAIPFSKSKFDKARLEIKLADVMVFTGNFNKALITYSLVQTALKNNSLAQEARFKVAQTSYFKGDFDWAKTQLKILKSAASQLIANDAVALFLTISNNQPTDSLPTGLKQYAKADLLAYQNKNTEALAVLQNIVTDFKGQPIEDEALFKEGKLLVKLKKFDQAIAAFSKVVAIDKEGILNDDAYYEMAQLYSETNDFEKAKECYQKIIFNYPSSIYLVDARKKYRKLRGDNI
ncbi:tetratricopeptide repeat protein [Tenacibaculum sp. UWU-22]|uniref:tetratricopeptide repeat protein n=1 Tax=Tenacibaculum sp. UWU-22 TaxID=3234187 RepID=UPI0034DB154E